VSAPIQEVAPVAEVPWHEANQQYILASLAALRARLAGSEKENGSGEGREGARRIAQSMKSPPALEELARTFALSAFERDVLLLAAGVELDSAFASVVAEAHGDARGAFPTFGLALSTLAEPHWSALAPSRPLRRWRLIELGPGGALTSRALQIDERVLHHIVGVDYVDHRLAGVLDARPELRYALPSHRAIATRIAGMWAAAERRGDPIPIVHLRGPDVGAKQAVAREVCSAVGLELLTVSQIAPLEDDALATLVARELRFSRAALLVVADDLEAAMSLPRALDRWNDPLLLSTRDRPCATRRPTLGFDVEKPLVAEQRALWGELVEDASPNAIEPVVSHFDLGAESIRLAAAAAAAAREADGTQDLGRAIWDACRTLSRPRLDGLAQRVSPEASWEDLVVPEPLRDMLKLVATHVAHRAKVHETWGFTRRGARGLGITALFSGPSGTGKTLAAEVLASALSLDLYRVDLSQVVSKYIGETEKNLRRVFDAAEEGAAVLLFDEADALFGKRSDVKDSHDRYANIEVSYLLQRMEAYRGLAILTTNMKNAIDPAFLRRIQFVGQFPFPNVQQRLAIWSRFFPEGSDVEGLDLAQLAQMSLAGGNIYNVARNAAFLAADAGTPLRMEHVLRAAKDEFAKLERPSNLPQREGA